MKTINQKDDGYRGLWYMNQPLENEYAFKYSGGLATYCAKHQPFAVYSKECHKTFFCYGGVRDGYHRNLDLDSVNLDSAKAERCAYHFVSCFDHATGTVPQPTILLDKQTYDAHDNPVISIDNKGYIWIFSTAHGSLRPAFVHRSVLPYDVNEFERVEPYRLTEQGREPISNFSYMQAWNIGQQGFQFFFTKYSDTWQRETCFGTSPDGIEWSWLELADIEEGHYQISAACEDKAACAFNYHPRAFRGNDSQKGLNWRTNLYYMETVDNGNTWNAANGTNCEVPLRQAINAALVRNYEDEGLLVYLKDIIFDAGHRPIILYITARDYHYGAEGDPRTWRLARWTGNAWHFSDITTSDSNYDMGSLFMEGDQLRVIAPTEVGPQSYNPGGEIAMWISDDDGKTWRMEKQLTIDSQFNHTYVRRPANAHPEFYGFWADGHGREPSASRLYYCNRAGDVFRLPEIMHQDTQTPQNIAQKTNS